MPANLLILLWRNPMSSREAFTAELHDSMPEKFHTAGLELAQMNVADAAVDAASPLRQVTLDPQPEALLRVELDIGDEADKASESTDVDNATGRSSHARTAEDTRTASSLDSATSTCTRALDTLADFTSIARSAGYLVTTGEPLADPNVRHSPGARTQGFSQLAMLRRRTDLSIDAFRERWLDHHTTVALETQSTFRYVQHIVLDALTPDAPRLDGIVEECFPTAAMTDSHVFFDTGGTDQELTDRLNTMVASVSAFLDLDSLDVIPTSEYRFDVT